MLGHTRVSDATDVPQLAENGAAVCMHSTGDFLPSGDMFLRPDAGRMRPLGSLLTDECGLGEDEGSSALSALRVIELPRFQRQIENIRVRLTKLTWLGAFVGRHRFRVRDAMKLRERKGNGPSWTGDDRDDILYVRRQVLDDRLCRSS
jgi:hypothetical protein